MKITTLCISALTFGLLISNTAQAIEKATINYDSAINWSSPIYNKFDGPIVHDRHSADGYEIVSSWSKKGIKLNVTKKITRQSVSQSITLATSPPLCVDNNPDPKKNSCPGFQQSPGIVRSYGVSDTSYLKSYPISHFIVFINNRPYRYDQGSVSPQLAQALANAPTKGSVRIKLFVSGESTVDSEVGVNTVKSWRQVFR
jgi:hypothetical protein